jgi:hypothetical protein
MNVGFGCTLFLTSADGLNALSGEKLGVLLGTSLGVGTLLGVMMGTCRCSGTHISSNLSRRDEFVSIDKFRVRQQSGCSE